MRTELGKGTYASVRRAVHRKHGHEVAVKIIDCARSMRSKEDRARLCREIEIMRTVKHENVVKMTEDFLDEKGGNLCRFSPFACSLVLCG